MVLGVAPSLVLTLFHHGLINFVYLFPVQRLWLSLLLPIAVDEEVSQDGQEPSPPVCPRLKFMEEAKGPQIGLLHQVGLGLVLGEVEGRGIEVQELGEGN